MSAAFGDRRWCLHELFETRVRAHPDAPALVLGSAQLTYAELDRRAERVADALADLGVGPDTLVGLFLPRSFDLIVGLLGIAKAGGGYLPIDPHAPPDRIAHVLDDSSAPIVLTDASLRTHLPPCAARVLEVESLVRATESEHAERRAANPGNIAYVIYTSGSTGKPKGVVIEHRHVVRLFAETDDWFRFGPTDVWTLFHSIAFDFSVWELWGALLFGGRVVIVPYELSRSPEAFYELCAESGVTVLNQTPSAFRGFIRAEETSGPRTLALRTVIFGGEALELQSLRPWFERHGDASPRLVNMYGITETTVHVTYRPITLADLDSRAGSVIGRPIPDLNIYLLDEDRREVPVGVTGEIYVGGAGVARGYLKRPELTAERFVQSPFAADARLYRSGDLARRREDGDIEYLGRIDHQVKIRGFRIELGEIESELVRHPAVREAAVVVAGPSDDPRLVAYVVARGNTPSSLELRRHLSSVLPEYMLPAHFVALPSLPMTINGKLDTRALPAPSRARPEQNHPYIAPRSETETAIARIFSELLEVEPVGVDDGFFELGGTSLLAVRAVSMLRSALGRDVPVARFFQGPTAGELARWLDQRAPSESAASHPRLAPERGERIAIVGFAGRFPGADSVEQLWENLCGGVESIQFFRDEELDAAVPAAVRGDPAYVRARGTIAGYDQFDPAFFGILPRDAELMDPQQRLFLEVAWEALERSGHVPGEEASIGVYAGIYGNSYLTEHVLQRPDLVEKAGRLHTLILNEKDFVATHAAHRLDLRGPAVSVHTACSTSLVAVCQAVTSLLAGDCDMALAGAASMTCPPRSGYVYQEGGMLSPDGHTRSFDARAAGTVFSDGAAVVVLKRLADAERDGDTIWAVIRGTAVNNDGAHKASFTAPSVEGQAAVIARAHAAAGIAADQVSYVETHGTATPLGDPIEVEALTQAFRRSTPKSGFCALGSLKSNIGHLVAASGAAGVIKVALALHHRQIPPSLHFEHPNPNIDFGSSPFFVNDVLRPWTGPEPLIAGVSSFGVGGTNAHVVLERAPVANGDPSALSAHLLPVSARSDAALDSALTRLADHLESHPDVDLADVAFTLGVGRKAFAHRATVVAVDRAAAVRALRTRTTLRKHCVEARPGVAFAFPGQGSQYVAMGNALYGVDPVFRAVLDHCAEILQPRLGGDLRALLYADADAAERAAQLRQTALTQPALFAVEYALAEMWRGLGIRPVAMIGHSVGEFVAATLAGVFSLEDALGLVATRARLMQRIAPGTMLGVRAPAADVERRLPQGVSIAADNAPSLCVASGPSDLVDRLRVELEAEGVVCRPLHTSHAFHSPMMEPVLSPLLEAVRAVRLAPNAVPIASTATGTWLRPEEATDPSYWAEHLLRTVRFGPAVATLLEPGSNVGLLLEVGPRATLATLVRQSPAARGIRVAASLGETPETEVETFLAGVGDAWSNGASVDFASLYAGERRRRVVLPTYPFERRRVWIDARPAAVVSEPIPEAPNVEVPTMTASAPTPNDSGRRARLVHELAELVEDVSGFDLDGADPNTSFLEQGLDSLTLTQVALQLGRKFGVKLSFRKLMEDLSSVARLAEFLDAELAPDAAAPPAATAPGPIAPVVPIASVPALPVPDGAVASPYVREVIDQQLRLMAQQLALLSGSGALPIAATPAALVSTNAPVPAPEPRPPADDAGAPQKYDPKKAFGAIARISTAPAEELGTKARARLDAFIRRYTARTRKSKEHTQAHRGHLADPRAVTGFRPLFKEIVYQIVIERSSGCRLWDIDGNEYIDVLSGFGSNLFGWQPDFLTDALKEQLARGHEIGPMPPLAAEVAELVCEFTGFDRAGFCNTGSEAVMGCMRIARTVTGRSTIAIFSGSYHGIFDEVIVRGTKKLKAVPAAPGIMPSSAANVLVLDYGTEQSLEILKARASELAAIMVEPVQSRRPDFQPREFLHELRKLADASGAVYVFDEVITGFRSHPGGAQAIFGVKADLASYGKVIGGGLPFGVIAGKREYMDALDGGFWQYGDDSAPTAGVTYFAGTFCRHPLALAAAKASLLRLKQQGPSLQETLTAKTTALATELNAYFRAVRAPLEIRHFASLWKTFFTEEQPYGELLFHVLRDNGIHVLEGFPCFMTTAHGDADIAYIVDAFKKSVAELQRSGFLSGGAPADEGTERARRTEPPVPGARLGRDPNGDPAWFVPNPEEPGAYVKLELAR